MAQRGLLDPEKEDPFALFVASTSIRYCYYHETHTILGNTYGMCVLQVSTTGWAPWWHACWGAQAMRPAVPAWPCSRAVYLYVDEERCLPLPR